MDDSTIIFVLAYGCDIHGIASSSVPTVFAPCSLAMLPFLLLVEGWLLCCICTHHNKSIIDPSTSLTCATKIAQQRDFKFLLFTYHVTDSTLQCIRKILEPCPLHFYPLTSLPQLHTPRCLHKFHWSTSPIQQRCNLLHIHILRVIY